jgi:hypothetical protein
MSAALTLHVPPDAGPDAVLALWGALAVTDGPIGAAVLREHAALVLGKQPRGEALALLRDLDLVTAAPAGVAASTRGRAVLADPAAADLIHGLSYVAWSPEAASRLSRMWTYRAVTDLLWELAPVTVDASLKKRLVEDLLARAEETFAGMEGFAAARASVGPKSIDGVLRWLERLAPVVVQDRRLRRRERCPPALMLVVLWAVAERAGAEPGTDFRLGPAERDLLCRGCFLEPVALDAMLDWTVQTQPRAVRWGTLNARYGRQLVLLKAPAFA